MWSKSQPSDFPLLEEISTFSTEIMRFGFVKGWGGYHFARIVNASSFVLFLGALNSTEINGETWYRLSLMTCGQSI